MKIKKMVASNVNSCKATRIYIFHDETILENLINRRSRPYSEYRKLLPKIFKRAKIPSTIKATWSQKAGCSCGCSPGFILKGHMDWVIKIEVTE